MVIETKYKFGDAVLVETKGRWMKDWIRWVVVQDNQKGGYLIRYQLTYTPGWVREVDLKQVTHEESHSNADVGRDTLLSYDP